MPRNVEDWDLQLVNAFGLIGIWMFSDPLLEIIIIIFFNFVI